MKTRPGKKLTVYVDETDKIHGRPIYEEIMMLCHRRGIAGVSVFRGMAGYGGQRLFHTSKILELSSDLPVKVEAVDTDAAITGILPEIAAILTKGLVEISDTTVIDISGSVS